MEQRTNLKHFYEKNRTGYPIRLDNKGRPCRKHSLTLAQQYLKIWHTWLKSGLASFKPTLAQNKLSLAWHKNLAQPGIKIQPTWLKPGPALQLAQTDPNLALANLRSDQLGLRLAQADLNLAQASLKLRLAWLTPSLVGP